MQYITLFNKLLVRIMCPGFIFLSLYATAVNIDTEGSSSVIEWTSSMHAKVS